MSNPSWGSIGALATGTTGAVTPVAPTHAAGDWLYILAEHSNASNGITPTLGGGTAFALLGSQTNNSTTSGFALYGAKATSSAETIPAIGGNAGQDHIQALVFSVSGLQNEPGDDPWASLIVQNLSNTAASALTLGALGAINATGVLVVDMVSRANDSAAAGFSGWANPDLANLTERYDAGTTVGNGGGFAINTGELAAPATLAGTTVTAANIRYAAISMALRSTVKATATVTGVSGTGSAGTVAAHGAASVSITGASASISAGSLAASGAAQATVTGAQATASAGTVAAEGGTGGTPGTAEVSGVSATAAAGDVAATGAALVVLPGASATASAGAVSANGGGVVPEPPRPVVGGGSVSFAGPARRRAVARVSGVQAQASVGRITAQAAARALLAGVLARAEVGRIGSQGAAIATVRGSRAFGFAGAVRAVGIEEITDDEILVLLMAIEP